MIRVERDSAICEHLKGDKGNLCGWPNELGEQILCLLVCLAIYFPLHIYVLRVLVLQT
jgi:hypothetical protein